AALHFTPCRTAAFALGRAASKNPARRKKPCRSGQKAADAVAARAAEGGSSAAPLYPPTPAQGIPFMTFRKTLRRLCASLNSGPPPKASKKSRPLGVEYLEDRWVLSPLQLSGGVLTYTAGAGIANKLTVSISGATYTFTDTAEPITVTGISGATGSGTNT